MGAYDLEASVQKIGENLLVAIWGGELPHIGAVAIAQPRPSLKDPDRISSTASVFCLAYEKVSQEKTPPLEKTLFFLLTVSVFSLLEVLF